MRVFHILLRYCAACRAIRTLANYPLEPPRDRVASRRRKSAVASCRPERSMFRLSAIMTESSLRSRLGGGCARGRGSAFKPARQPACDIAMVWPLHSARFERIPTMQSPDPAAKPLLGNGGKRIGLLTVAKLPNPNMGLRKNLQSGNESAKAVMRCPNSHLHRIGIRRAARPFFYGEGLPE